MSPSNLGPFCLDLVGSNAAFGRYVCVTRRTGTVVEQAEQLLSRGENAAARDLLRQATRHGSEPRAMRLLAIAHSELGEDEQALACAQLAAADAPENADAVFLHANALRLLKRDAEAATVFERVVALAPDNLDFIEAYATVLERIGRVDDAFVALDRAIARRPDDPGAYLKAANARQREGLIPEAVAVVRAGISRVGEHHWLLDRLCYLMNFFEGFDPLQHRALHEALGRSLGSGRDPSTFANASDPDRPLRVAYVSSSFRVHACAFFLLGLLEAHDPSQVEVFLYSTQKHDDALTPRFAAIGTLRQCAMMNDAEMLAQAERDRIDVAVDLCGWTDGHRLEAFAKRLAPVQATYLGYPNTTGVPAMDVRLVDAISDPPGTDAHATERLARLGRCFLAYTPPTDVPEPTRSRAMIDPAAPIVFASFNRSQKASGAALDLWAAVLRHVPNSMLLIKERTLGETARARMLAAMLHRGIDAARIIFAGETPRTGDHFASYCNADIALDTYPYHGTTTTCEALWMGVPVVTLMGSTHRARVGGSILSTVGLPMLACQRPEDLVRVCMELASSRATLAQLRGSLRGMMARSPLMDSLGLARAIEGVYRAQWRSWCDALAPNYHRSA